VRGADEYRVKAAILFNLARFVEWPATAFPGPAAPLVICVVGTDPFGPVLDETLQGHTVGGRQTAVRRLPDVAAGCHVVFIASSEEKRVADILERLRGSSVLTLSELDGFTEQGGTIGLSTAGDRVRFDINASAAEAARLTVSARVMALASSVRRGAGARP
jgi:hypothetical protein